MKQFSVFYFNIHPIFQTVHEKVSEFNNACHKNMYKYIFPLLARLAFILHYVYEWIESARPRPSHPLIEEDGRLFWSWNFACSQNNTRHDSESLHVLPFSCFSFWFPFTKEFVENARRRKEACLLCTKWGISGSGALVIKAQWVKIRAWNYLGSFHCLVAERRANNEICLFHNIHTFVLLGPDEGELAAFPFNF